MFFLESAASIVENVCVDCFILLKYAASIVSTTVSYLALPPGGAFSALCVAASSSDLIFKKISNWTIEANFLGSSMRWKHKCTKGTS